LRIPLHSKKSKRCPTCRHILIKPEQKAQSVRYKIKLVAANYLPAIKATLPQPADPARRARTEDASGANGMLAGGTYPFHLSLTNPLYDPIQVRLSVQRQIPSITSTTASATPDAPPEKVRRPPFAVSLPSSAFPIDAFAEAWEYEDDEDMFGVEDDEFGLDGRGEREKDGRAKSKTVGVLEKRANVTIVGGEVVIGKEAKGEVKFNMLVSYTYRSDDPLGDEDVRNTPSRTTKAPEMKTFSFYTVVELGEIVAREESRPEVDF